MEQFDTLKTPTTTGGLLSLREAESVRWDCLSLGEVMLRLDPGEGRIHTAREFKLWEGGGEYNLSRGLRRCFGLRTGLLTALADNSVGRLIEDLILQGGVDTSLIQWVPYDGVGQTVRNGLNFVERGFGVRAAVGCSDRGHTAASQLTPESYDWDLIFGENNGTRWFHTGGIFAGLSATTPSTILAAIHSARNYGTIVSYDLNYRDSLWRAHGGHKEAIRCNRAIVEVVDVLFGHRQDFLALLDRDSHQPASEDLESRVDESCELMREMQKSYPNLKIVSSTLRKTYSASRNGWNAAAVSSDEACRGPWREIEVFDRIGGGDSFASGLVYGIMSGQPLQWSLECGLAHGALAMTTPGDNGAATMAEVMQLMQDAVPHITR